MKQARTIHDLPKIDRPREKLIKYGVNKLSNPELLAILLRSGTKKENVIELSRRLLRRFKGKEIVQANFKQLQEYHGLGPAKACEIVACFELGRRFLKDKKACIYLKPEQVWQELKDIRSLKKEHFIVFYLDVRNQEIKREIISVGSLSASLVHPREVFEPAVRQTAAQIIIAHNHPAGDPEPSPEDITITKRLVASGKILGIEIVDHVIVSRNKWFSFKKNRVL